MEQTSEVVVHWLSTNGENTDVVVHTTDENYLAVKYALRDSQYIMYAEPTHNPEIPAWNVYFNHVYYPENGETYLSSLEADLLNAIEKAREELI